MSDHIPKREVGDRVRVMDTTSAEQRGIAGMTGVVKGTLGAAPWGDVFYNVEADGGCCHKIEGSMLGSVPSSSNMGILPVTTPTLPI